MDPLGGLLLAQLSAPLPALKMAPKRVENRPPNSSQTALKSTLGPLGELLELSWQPGSLLLEASGAQKTLLGSALGRPKGTKETGFALPEGQMGD